MKESGVGSEWITSYFVIVCNVYYYHHHYDRLRYPNTNSRCARATVVLVVSRSTYPCTRKLTLQYALAHPPSRSSRSVKRALSFESCSRAYRRQLHRFPRERASMIACVACHGYSASTQLDPTSNLQLLVESTSQTAHHLRPALHISKRIVNRHTGNDQANPIINQIAHYRCSVADDVQQTVAWEGTQTPRPNAKRVFVCHDQEEGRCRACALSRFVCPDTLKAMQFCTSRN